MAAVQGQGSPSGCGTPAPLLHTPRPNPPDTCCLPCLRGVRRLCLLRPLPTLQLSPWPPGPSPLRTPSRCERRPQRQMATFGSRAVPGHRTLLGSSDRPAGKPPPHPARAGDPSPTAASAGQGVQRGSPGWARCLHCRGARMVGGHGGISSLGERGSVLKLSPSKSHPLIFAFS